MYSDCVSGVEHVCCSPLPLTYVSFFTSCYPSMQCPTLAQCPIQKTRRVYVIGYALDNSKDEYSEPWQVYVCMHVKCKESKIEQ